MRRGLGIGIDKNFKKSYSFRMNTVITTNLEDEIPYESFVFSGGEVSVKLKITPKVRHSLYTEVKFFCRPRNSADLFELAILKDAVLRERGAQCHLALPYVPYGRQDRVCDSGEAFSLKVFCSFLNNLAFDTVTIVDPHSEVTPALIENVKVISQFEIFQKWRELSNRVQKGVVFVSPDGGAIKKTSILAKYFTLPMCRADKIRDLTNGNILETIVYKDDFGGVDVLCADDLADGSRTFTELAKVCKSKNCGKFILFVTHGIFSKGLDVCFDNGIDEIWTTTAFRDQDLDGSGWLNVFDIKNLL